MNIISIGCSWTYGLGLDKSQTYPAHLQDLLSDTTVINGGHAGADIDHAIYTGIRLIKEWKPKVCIFQLTTTDRITLGTDGADFFRHKPYTNKDFAQDVYYENPLDQKYIRLLGIGDEIKTKLTVGNLVSSKKDFKKLLVESKVKAGAKDLTSFIRLLFENVIFSPYRIQKICDSLFLFNAFLKSNNIIPLYFSWLPVAPPIVKNSIECENFISHSVSEFFDKEYPSHSLYIDNGFHLSNKGNKILAEEYLYPQLKRLL